MYTYINVTNEILSYLNLNALTYRILSSYKMKKLFLWDDGRKLQIDEIIFLGS